MAKWRLSYFIVFFSTLTCAVAQHQSDQSVCTPHHFSRVRAAQRVTQETPSMRPPEGKVKIPVVIHVLHHGDSGRISMDQARSGLAIINRDFAGENQDFNEVDPRFDSLKATMTIEFFLATIDPEGNPTSGIVYHNDEEAAFNSRFKIYDYAWDNFRYLNIYLPIYSYGAPSVRTAYATLPSTGDSQNSRDGIVQSSIRWGYGDKSELEEDSELLSIATHEVGHWLNLKHPFSSSCAGVGDSVDDTPPTLGDSISFTGCNNFDFSCGVPTNGSNYMDYNHGCKKMFTKGQVQRMREALVHPARVNHWSVENLIATGGITLPTDRAIRFFNDSNGTLTAIATKEIASLEVRDINGKLLYQGQEASQTVSLNSVQLEGLLFYLTTFSDNTTEKGKFFAR